MELRSTTKPLVIAGKYPSGGWTPYYHGFYGYSCIGDGNCFWRAAAVQLYGDQEQYEVVRKKIVDYVKNTSNIEIEGLSLPLALEASGFPSVDAWFEATLTDGYFGGFVEAALLAKCFDVRVEIYTGTVPSIPTQQIFNPYANLALRLHFRNNHYDALFVHLPNLA
jgi:hypothetical protein